MICTLFSIGNRFELVKHIDLMFKKSKITARIRLGMNYLQNVIEYINVHTSLSAYTVASNTVFIQ